MSGNVPSDESQGRLPERAQLDAERGRLVADLEPPPELLSRIERVTAPRRASAGFACSERGAPPPARFQNYRPSRVGAQAEFAARAVWP